MNEEEKIVCSGKTFFPFIMGLFFMGMGVGVFFPILISMATYEVKGIFSICLILCVLEGSYFLLFLYRKFLKSSEIVYNRLEIKNDIAKERRGLRHDVVYEVFCFGLG